MPSFAPQKRQRSAQRSLAGEFSESETSFSSRSRRVSESSSASGVVSVSTSLFTRVPESNSSSCRRAFESSSVLSRGFDSNSTFTGTSISDEQADLDEPISSDYLRLARLPLARRLFVDSIAEGGVLERVGDLLTHARGFRVLPLSSRRLNDRYSINDKSVASALVGYKKIASEIEKEFGKKKWELGEKIEALRNADEWSEDVGKRLKNYYEEMAKFDPLIKNIQQSKSMSEATRRAVEKSGRDWRIFVMVNKRDKRPEKRGPAPIFGVATVQVRGGTATLESLVAHPLTQVDDELGNAVRQKLSADREAAEMMPADHNFRLKHVGLTLTAHSLGRVLRKDKPDRVHANPINQRSVNIGARLRKRLESPPRWLSRLLRVTRWLPDFAPASSDTASHES